MGVGLFGKLPAHGDFISRNLPGPLRKSLDLWITHNIGQETLPDGGLCKNLTLSGTPITAVILPSRDKSGRIFPVVAVIPEPAGEATGMDEWYDQIAALLRDAVSTAIDVDTLLASLPAAPKAT
ncbi:TagF domain-containing protein [Cognatiyoonia sp. IB215182]|uniref:TagF domain-containing protein n=1 Tax=Cognatiyoonia sp. IB215182 TaxID=3097353 RepID=UPI002A11E623|nr:TagF domain-containing protein [Cognatiyoonia sp. IB215182]MDX8352696.1 TagF domain-containing protein [Cognatiyoonia sp. IB215182]